MSKHSIRKNRPAMRLKLGRWLSINKKALFALGNPANIYFWRNKSGRVLLISEAPEKTPLSIKINDCYYNTKSGFQIERSDFIQTVLQITGWRSDMIYIITGDYISELNMVVFKIDDAMELEVESGMGVDAD